MGWSRKYVQLRRWRGPRFEAQWKCVWCPWYSALSEEHMVSHVRLRVRVEKYSGALQITSWTLRNSWSSQCHVHCAALFVRSSWCRFHSAGLRCSSHSELFTAQFQLAGLLLSSRSAILMIKRSWRNFLSTLLTVQFSWSSSHSAVLTLQIWKWNHTAQLS